MTPDFESHRDPELRAFANSLAGNLNNHNQSTGASHMLKRDRFELLSAYLDGEVTAPERKQVEEWLATDPAIQRLYGRLLMLRQGLRSMPVPTTQQPVEQTVEQVFFRLDRRPKLTLVWGGAAIAALFIGALSGVLPNNRSTVPQVAQSSQQQIEPAPEALMIALDHPVVEIPKAPIADPEQKPDNSIYPNSTDNVR